MQHIKLLNNRKVAFDEMGDDVFISLMGDGFSAYGTADQETLKQIIETLQSLVKEAAE